MAHGNFIWCDLSAYDPDAAMAFYTAVFGWDWTDKTGATRMAWLGDQPVASIYQMPKKFIDMNMPSFWMSYIAVSDTSETTRRAKSLGGKVELGPAEFQPGSQYALIRDPLGAGFTVIDGHAPTSVLDRPGARHGHALFVSDVSKINDFYSELFGWVFHPPQNGAHPVFLDGEHLFHCHEIPDPAIRGEEQYWSVLFRQRTGLPSIAENGGDIEAQFDFPEGRAVLARDAQGAAFMVVDVSR